MYKYFFVLFFLLVIGSGLVFYKVSAGYRGRSAANVLIAKGHVDLIISNSEQYKKFAIPVEALNNYRAGNNMPIYPIFGKKVNFYEFSTSDYYDEYNKTMLREIMRNSK